MVNPAATIATSEILFIFIPKPLALTGQLWIVSVNSLLRAGAAALLFVAEGSSADCRGDRNCLRCVCNQARERPALVLPSPVTTDNQALIVQLAAKYKLPAIYPYRDLAQGGGLISYGPNLSDDYRSAASYVDRILRGEKLANLPDQAPTRFEIILDLRTARALGLTVPQSLLATADEIIE
jgi:hypothetical protein